MQKTLLLRMLSGIALVLTICLPTFAQSNSNLGVVVNSKVIERKVTTVYTSSTVYGDTSVPRVIVEYAPLGEKWSSKTDYDSFHPAVVKVLFGDALTAINDLHVREIESVEDGNLHFRGLKAGERIVVYTTGGRHCLTTTATSEGAVVGMKSLPRGVYVIKSGSTAFKYINR